jgi:hypothetical protein
MKLICNILLFACTIFCLVLTSCSKDDSAASANLKMTLISLKWKLGKLVVAGTDLTSTVDACERDNYLKFSSDGKYNLHADGVKCDSNEAEILETGDWSLSSDQKTFTLNGQSQTVVTSNSNTFVVKTSTPFGDAVTTYSGF